MPGDGAAMHCVAIDTHVMYMQLIKTFALEKQLKEKKPKVHLSYPANLTTSNFPVNSSIFKT